MPDIKCSNPACQTMNPDTRTFCSKCGWRLPRATVVEPQRDLAALQAAYSDLEQQNNQLVLASKAQQEQLDKTVADHAQLAAVNQGLSASQQELQEKHDTLALSHQDTVEKHQAAVTALSATQKQLDQSESWRQKAVEEINELRAKLESIISNPKADNVTSAAAEGEIARLGKLLTEAESAYKVEAAKVRKFEDSGIGQATWPLRKKIMLGLLAAVVGSAGGVTAGIYTPLNSARKQLKGVINGETQQEQSNAVLASQLKQAKDDLDKSSANVAAQQQTNAKLTEQISNLNQGSQAASHQMSTIQGQLIASKAETAKEHTEAVTLQQELQAEKTQVRELGPKAALAASLQATIAAHPSLNYKGPMQGVITIRYSGKNDKPSTISLDNFSSTADSGTRVDAVSGNQLPGVPVLVEPLGNNISVITPPAQSNNWRKIKVSVQGKGSNTVSLRWTVF